MESTLDQLERLKRHHDAAINTRDRVAFLDLAHTLRVWVEMCPELQETHKGILQRKLFVSTSPPRKLRKLLKGLPFILLNTPGGVTIPGLNSLEIVTPKDSVQFMGGEMTIGNRSKLNVDGSVTFTSFYCNRGERIPRVLELINNSKQSRMNFTGWLSAESCRIQYFSDTGALEHGDISRRNLIKRVANTLGGSHPATSEAESKNRYDPLVRFLLNFKCGGVPIPYFILVKPAEDILKHIPTILLR